MPEIYIVKGDLNPDVRAQLIFPDGTKPDLTGGQTVKFYMSDDNGNVLIDGHDAVIVDAANCIVRYIWQTGETELIGPCHAEFKIFDGIETQTFPAADNFVIRFRESN